MNEPDTFESFVLAEILEAKANWLGAVCASLIPNQIARLDVKGNLDKCRKLLTAKGATIREFEGRSEVWLKKKNGDADVKLAVFGPALTDDGKLEFLAFIAGVRVDVGSPIVLPEQNKN